jgi:hypothetical protein
MSRIRCLLFALLLMLSLAACGEQSRPPDPYEPDRLIEVLPGQTLDWCADLSRRARGQLRCQYWINKSWPSRHEYERQLKMAEQPPCLDEWLADRPACPSDAFSGEN